MSKIYMPDGTIVEVESKSFSVSSNGTIILYKGCGQSEGCVGVAPKEALVIL